MAAPRALVIGGGIGGLAAAVALRRVGIGADVFERAPEIREVGAGLSLWSNAVVALRCLGLEEAVRRSGSPVLRMRTLSADGRTLTETSLEDVARKAGAPSLCAHRADLQRVLAEALPPSAVHTGRECTGVRQEGGRVVARFADGREEAGDLLVGADGIRSAVRAALFGPAEPRYAGYTCWRGIARFEHPDLPPGLALFAVGRGTQMGLFQCGPGRVYWFVTRNAPAGTTSPPGGNRRAVLDLLDRWPPVLRAAVEAADEAAVFQNDIIDRPPTRDWGTGRVTLLGDAVHATTPNLGQGACQALEDAVVLADRLRGSTDIPAGLRAYEDARRDRTAMVVKRSRALGSVFQWQNPLAVWLRNRLFTLKVGERQGVQFLETLLCHPLPELPPAGAAAAS
ncbi:MAG TPA: FAD-dependent monooxygenase [Gemmataceae bacterium]